MRLFFSALLLCLGCTASAAEVLDLNAYFMTVKSGKKVVYTHDVYDRNHVSRLELKKTVTPSRRDGRFIEDMAYSLVLKDKSGNFVGEATLDEAMYTDLRTKIESAKMETATINWNHGCQIRAVVDQQSLVNLLSLCDENKNPAGDSTGTIEAEAVR